MDKLDLAEQIGRICYFLGISWNESPYKIGSDEWNCWCDGWESEEEYFEHLYFQEMF